MVLEQSETKKRAIKGEKTWIIRSWESFCSRIFKKHRKIILKCIRNAVCPRAQK